LKQLINFLIEWVQVNLKTFLKSHKRLLDFRETMAAVPNHGAFCWDRMSLLPLIKAYFL